MTILSGDGGEDGLVEWVFLVKLVSVDPSISFRLSSRVDIC
jgi:hypothetical protein